MVERLSDGLMRILGRPGSELVGKPLRETMPEVVSKMREGARERLLAGEEVLLVQSFFALERWFEILGRPLGGSFLVHFHDITERLQAEAARHRSEERFQILVNGVSDYAIRMLDPKGHIASWSAAAERMSGYPADEVLGKPVAFLFPPELVERGEPRRRLEETVRRGSFKTEARFFRRDGSPVIFQSTHTSLFDEPGAPRRLIEYRSRRFGCSISSLVELPTSSNESGWKRPSVTRSKHENTYSASSRTTSETRSA